MFMFVSRVVSAALYELPRYNQGRISVGGPGLFHELEINLQIQMLENFLTVSETIRTELIGSRKIPVHFIVAPSSGPQYFLFSVSNRAHLPSLRSANK
jgi:hypothetical protein